MVCLMSISSIFVKCYSNTVVNIYTQCKKSKVFLGPKRRRTHNTHTHIIFFMQVCVCERKSVCSVCLYMFVRARVYLCVLDIVCNKYFNIFLFV